MSEKFEVLTGRDQILKRPQMWIGSMDPIKQDMFILNENTVEHKEVEFIPAFRKIIDEILDNSLDALIEKCNANGVIKVEMTEDSVFIEDDGPGIPVIKKKLSEAELKSLPEAEAKKISDSYIPEIAWTRLFSGSNFQDSANKTTIGSHGIGSKASAIFSTKFVGKTDDGKRYCTVKAMNNLEKSSCKTDKSSGKTGTSVEFWPDLAKFKLTKIEQVYFDLMYQRLLCLAITFPKIKFSFNKKRINVNDKKFLSMFSENIEFQTFEHGFIGVYPNVYDDFRFFTYVNGLNMFRGGNHIEYIINNIVSPVRDKLEKKYKTIKPADIRNKLTLVVFMRDFPNLKFDSQTKETLTNAPSEISAYLGNSIDFEKFGKQLLKNAAIIEPIVETFKIKEELKARQELKQVKKAKVKSDKYMRPEDGSGQKYLALCEGASAMSGISGSLGRKGIGYYAMRGLPLNAYSSSMQKIVANQELKDIVNILGLDITKDDKQKTIDFEKILISTDADCYAGNTVIQTDSGLKEIKDITYNDKVMSSDGKYHQVLDIVEKKTKELVVLKTNSGHIVVSPKQKMLVCRNGKIQEIFAAEVLETDFLLKRKSDRKASGLDLSCFDLAPVLSMIETSSSVEEKLYDITVEGDHTFFIKLPESEDFFLMHNCDGNHITSMLIGWFKRFAPNLFNEGKICKLVTPLILVKDSKDKILHFFMNVPEFKVWEAKNPKNTNKIIYLKGLGSWDRQDLIDLIAKYGISRFIQEYKLDDEGKTYIEDWLGDDPEKRKTYLREYSFDINQA